MKVRLRCSEGKSGCGKYFSLPKHPDLYSRKPKCPHCGCLKYQLIDKWRQAEKRRQKRNDQLCYCNAYPFPHVKGSLRFCKYHEKYDVEPTPEEFEAYQNVLDTPRGAFQ